MFLFSTLFKDCFVIKLMRPSRIPPINRFSSLQGTPTRWPQKYQSTNDSVNLSQTSSRSRASDDENATQSHHHPLSHQSSECRRSGAICLQQTKLINRRNIAGSSTRVAATTRQRAAWQTVVESHIHKVNASSDGFHTITLRMMYAKWIEIATDTVTKLITCIVSSTLAAFASKLTSMTCRRVHSESHSDVTLSTVDGCSIGRLQAVPGNCCQFLYSLICFHFCMQVSSERRQMHAALVAVVISR